ncbi:archaea-specific SMC-related protein [Haladaptatus halobius]|uniref:archaea-specific SMC-related protein n=1 Tax=Haladaptatus halobius TaxID=2884875 RepID=UPI001D0AFA13|nr:archaea-specific SMC-related protein [Haladaptatus halobius]
MKISQQDQHHIELSASNIGGIDHTDVEFSPGVTVLMGRNATNRTSFLQAIMAALGSDQVTLKGDADKGSVELTIDDETYTRTLTRTNGVIKMSGNPYLDDTELAELFAFLLESNEARRAVARDDDLRDLIMRPVDTDTIQAEIDRCETEKQQIDTELETLDSLKQQHPNLEQKRTRLETEIEDKQAELEAKETELEEADTDISETRDEKAELDEKLEELRETRSTLESVRFKISTEEDSIEALKDELAELETEQEQLPDDAGETAEIEQEIQTRRERKQQLSSTLSELQTIIQFNEEMLQGTSPDVRSALAPTTTTDEGSDGSITDQLVADSETVVCWTCGTEVDKQEIEATLERLRTLRQDTLGERSELDSEISEFEREKSNLETKQREREQTERRLSQINNELEDREDRLEDLRSERADLTDDIEKLEDEVEALEQEDYSEVLDLHKEANQLEFELERLESDLDDVEAEIEEIDAKLAEREQLEAQREEIQAELADLRTRIEQIEQNAVDEFNTHMETVLELLDYANLERIWIERTQQDVREGRRKVTKSVFSLHVIRSTESGTAYEDTIEHLSESEREVTGLVFALAGYLAHEVYEDVPFILLDSLEAIDSDRIATLVDYFSEYAGYLVAALLPEDAAALDDAYERVTEI